jgi:mRNA interferase RelE/StbE
LAWIVEYDPRVERDLRALDKGIQREILNYMETRVAGSGNPKSFGKALRHCQKGLWRYRLRDYRIICEIQADRLIVFVVAVGHRSKIYG